MFGSFRAWLFRGLTLIATGLMVFSWFQYWWVADIFELGKNAVIIRPWGLVQNVGEIGSIYGADMPAFFAPAMWTYLVLAIAALLFSLFAPNKHFKIWKLGFTLPSFLIGFVGFSYIIVVILAVIVAAIRTGDFGMALIGTTFIPEPYPGSDVTGRLEIGYWLACVAGSVLLLLGILRNKIIGKID